MNAVKISVENISKYSKLKTIITEIKNQLEGMNSRFKDMEEWSSLSGSHVSGNRPE